MTAAVSFAASTCPLSVHSAATIPVGAANLIKDTAAAAIQVKATEKQMWQQMRQRQQRKRWQQWHAEMTATEEFN